MRTVILCRVVTFFAGGMTFSAVKPIEKRVRRTTWTITSPILMKISWYRGITLSAFRCSNCETIQTCAVTGHTIARVIEKFFRASGKAPFALIIHVGSEACRTRI